METRPTPRTARRAGAPATGPAAEAAGREAPPRVLLCERGATGATPIYAELKSLGIEPIRSAEPRSMLDEAARRPPDVVICDLAIGCREDLFMLELLRRVAPAVPLILVASEESLVTQRLVQGLRPMYYMVGPVEGPELRQAVEAALARRQRARG